MRRTWKILTALILMCFVASFLAGCGKGSTEPSSHESSDTPAILEAISVSPDSIEMGLGKSLQYNALGKYDDGTLANLNENVTWNSSDSSVADVSSEGLITAIGYGIAEIIATLEDIEGLASLIVPSPPVVQSLSLPPSVSELTMGQTLQLTATVTYSDGSIRQIAEEVDWASSNPQALTISSYGLAEAQSAGSATIKAVLGSESNSLEIRVIDPAPALESISITPSTPVVIEKDSFQLATTATYSDGSTRDITTEVLWASSDAEIAAISALGLIQAQAEGEAIITATLGEGIDSISLTVEALEEPPILLPEEEGDDSMMTMVQGMLTMMLENPQGTFDMVIGMLKEGTLVNMLKWLCQPGVLAELLRFLGQMIAP